MLLNAGHRGVTSPTMNASSDRVSCTSDMSVAARRTQVIEVKCSRTTCSVECSTLQRNLSPEKMALDVYMFTEILQSVVVADQLDCAK